MAAYRFSLVRTPEWRASGEFYDFFGKDYLVAQAIS